MGFARALDAKYAHRGLSVWPTASRAPAARLLSAMRLRCRLSLIALAFAAAGVACDTGPVDWGDPIVINEVGGPARLVVDSGGHASFVADPARTVNAPPSVGLCTTSLRTIPSSVHLFSAWWNVRRDSSSVLLIASSADSGKSWGRAVVVDTTDVSSAGCNRPPPSVATVGDDLFVAYSMIAPEGKGVFFAHSMGPMVHAPVAVIYGDRLVQTAIAAEGDDVAVAYEDPNGSRQQVAVAFSTVQGHIFAWRATASRSVDVATSPAVALTGRVLAVSWAARRASDSTATRVVRVGRIR
jgi:hypothetical protein